MKKSQLKQLIGSTLREILAEKESETEKLLNMKIKNPKTGNDIKLKSALGYPQDSQVYKAAKTAHDKAVDIVGKDSGEKGDPANEPTKEPAWNEMKKSKGNEVPSFWSNAGADVGETPSHKEMANAQETWLTSDNGAREQDDAVWAHFNDAMTSNDAARQEGAMAAMAKNMYDYPYNQGPDGAEEFDDWYNASEKAEAQQDFVNGIKSGAKQTFKTIPGGEEEKSTETQPHAGYGDTRQEQSKSFEKMASQAAQRSKDALDGGDKELANSFKNTATNALNISKFLGADHGVTQDTEKHGGGDWDDDVDYYYDEDGEMRNKKTDEPMGPRESTKSIKLKDLIRR